MHLFVTFGRGLPVVQPANINQRSEAESATTYTLSPIACRCYITAPRGRGQDPAERKSHWADTTE
jgi:hypothetical protein